jgi:hypothetical protein
MQTGLSEAQLADHSLPVINTGQWARAYASLCVQRFSLAHMTPADTSVRAVRQARENLMDLAQLYIWTGRDSLSTVALSQILSQVPVQLNDREMLFSRIVRMFINASNGIDHNPVSEAQLVRAAQQLAPLDAMGDTAIADRVSLRDAIAATGGWRSPVARRVAREAITLAQKPPLVQSIVQETMGSYTTLVLAAWHDGRRSAARALLDSANAVLVAVHAPDWVHRTLVNAVVPDTMIGQKAPRIVAQTWFNTSSEHPVYPAPGHVVLFEFTNHSCSICRASYPVILAWQRKYAARGLDVVIVTQTYGYFQDQQDVALADELRMDRDYFVKEHGFTDPIAVFTYPDLRPGTLAPDSPNFSMYGVTALPGIVLVDSNDVVQSITGGWDREIEARLGEQLSHLLPAGR